MEASCLIGTIVCHLHIRVTYKSNWHSHLKIQKLGIPMFACRGLDSDANEVL
jgi:hypothetical protein